MHGNYNSCEPKKIEPINQKVSIETMIMVDSGGLFTILIESLACPVVATDELCFWICSASARELGPYLNRPIPIVGKIQSSITINDHAADPVDIIVFKDGQKPLLGRDVFPQFELSTLPQPE